MSFFKQLGSTAKTMKNKVKSTLERTVIPTATRALNQIPIHKFNSPTITGPQMYSPEGDLVGYIPVTSSGSQQMYSPSGEWEGPGNAPNTFGLEPYTEAALKAAEPHISKLDAIGRSKINSMTHAVREKNKNSVKEQTYREIDGSNTMTEREKKLKDNEDARWKKIESRLHAKFDNAVASGKRYIHLDDLMREVYNELPKELKGGRRSKRRNTRRRKSRK